MSDTKTLLVKALQRRLDKFLADALRPLTRSYLQKLIAQGHVTVNGLPAEAAGRPLAPGDRVAVSLPDFSGLPASAADDVPLLFEDADLVVVDKPSGVVVHPAGPHQEDTLIQRLWPKLAPAWGASIKGTAHHTARPGVVHRLDKGTSGVLVIAKTPAAAEALSRQFAGREVEKTYWALVHGEPQAGAGVIKSNVGRDRRKPHRMSTAGPGKPAELAFRVLARAAGASLLEVRPLTGRTHQIRVQLSSVGHPLVGDATYGGQAGERPWLHALRLSFSHPRTGKRLSLSAPLPPDFREALQARGLSAPDKFLSSPDAALPVRRRPRLQP